METVMERVSGTEIDHILLKPFTIEELKAVVEAFQTDHRHLVPLQDQGSNDRIGTASSEPV